MTRTEHDARRAILTRLIPIMSLSRTSEAPTLDEALLRRRAVASAYRRIKITHATKRLAARLGVVLGALFLATAVLSLMAAMRSPWHAVVFLLGLAWAAWGKRWLSTHH